MRNTRIHNILLPLLLTFISLPLAAQYYYDFNERCQQANEALLDLRLDEAERYIVVEKQLHPANNIPYLLESYLLFFKVFISDEEAMFRRYDKRREAIYDRLDEGDSGSPYYLYCKAVVNAQWGLARMKFSEFVTAAFEFRKANIQLDKNRERFPEFLYDNLYSGIFHIAVGSVPDGYHWLVNLLGFSGNIKQGEAEIKEIFAAMGKDKLLSSFRREVLFYKVFLDMNVTGNLQSSYDFYLQSKEKQDTSLLRSPLLAYAFSRLLKEMKYNKEAVKLLENRHQEKEYYPFYYLDYLTGYYKLQALDSTANRDLLKFIEHYKGRIYLKSAYQKLSWYYLIQGDSARYFAMQKKILVSGNLLSDDDKQADFEAREGKIPNVYLLEARLLSDGGYFARAEAILIRNKTAILRNSAPKEQLEYYYRLGRIYHEWGKTAKAIPYYEQTIRQGVDLPYYFAANSALKLGNIYEKKHDTTAARKYYRWATEMKNEEYKSSITQKAKAGLQRLEEQ